MSLVMLSCEGFAEKLASRDSVPGGGGAAALAGALGAALASMVGNLTTGKKKYAAYEEDIQRILISAEELRLQLLGCVDKDAEAFAPLARAYGIPKDDPGRAEIMEQALNLACSVPLEIIRLCVKALALLEELAEKGSTLAVSDVGCGATMCRAAAESASLSVYINTKAMQNRTAAAEIEAETENLVKHCVTKADSIFEEVSNKLR